MKFKGKTKMRAGIAMFAFAFMAPGLALCMMPGPAMLVYLIPMGVAFVMVLVIFIGAIWLFEGQAEAKDESH